MDNEILSGQCQPIYTENDRVIVINYNKNISYKDYIGNIPQQKVCSSYLIAVELPEGEYYMIKNFYDKNGIKISKDKFEEYKMLVSKR